MRPLPKESDSAPGASAGWGWGCGLPAPGLQGAEHGIQWLECGLFLHPEPLPGHQPELQPLQQLGHHHLHLHLRMWGWGRVGVSEHKGHEHWVPSPWPGQPGQGSDCVLDQTKTLASYLSKLLSDAGARAQ